MYYTHFRYTSTGPLFFCFLALTMSTDDANRIRYDTSENHAPQAHTHTEQPHRTRPTSPTPTRGAKKHTQTHQGQGQGHPWAHSQEWRAGPPTTTGRPQPGVAGNHAQGPRPGVARDHAPHPAANPSQEWRGTATKTLSQEWRGTHHHHKTADPSQELRGTAPTTLSQEWRGTHNIHQPHTQNTSRKRQPSEAGTRNNRPLAQHAHATTYTSARGRHTHTTPPHHTTNNTHNTNTQNAQQHDHHAQPLTPQTHTTRNTPQPHETPHRNRQTPPRSGGKRQPGREARSGKGPNTTTAS